MEKIKKKVDEKKVNEKTKREERNKCSEWSKKGKNKEQGSKDKSYLRVSEKEKRKEDARG